MIPKKIHYFWFGRGPKSTIEEECIARFARYAPNFEIIEWNEDSFDVFAHSYSAQAYKDKKWAFVSDYARLKVLYDEGGIYLDTDMFLVRELSPLLNHQAFIGKEDEHYISAGIIGAEQKNNFIKDTLDHYDTINDYVTIPRALTEVYNKKEYDLKVYPPEVFYPFNQYNIKNFDKNNPPEGALAVHMWNYSWGSPVIKLTKKLGVHRLLVTLAGKIGIKKALKGLLKSE